MNFKIYVLWIFVGLLHVSNVYSQSPGGITPAAWYKADAAGTVFSDAGVTPALNNSTIHQWNSVIGNFPLLQASSGSRPVFSNTSVLTNFNPTVTFDGSNDWMQFTAGTGVNVIDRTNGTLYAAGYMNQLKRSGFLGFHPSMDYPGLHFFSDNKMLFFTGGPGYQGVSADVMKARTYFNTGTGWQNGGGSSAGYAGATVSLNGTRTDYAGAQLNNANLSTGARDLRIGADNNYGSFSGQLNEVIIFEDRLTTTQMDQLETYLSVKYGTTYAHGVSDYKNSAGGVVWNATANNGFHNNIAGIARDDMGALYQKQSWSTNAGQQVLIGVGGLANTNATNGGTLSNNQYLVWGDNGMAKAPTVVLTGFTGLSHRFASVWKVQNNGVGTVRVAWVKGLSGLTLIQSADAVFDASDVATAMTGEITVNGIVYNYADVTLANSQYFTIGAKLAGPGGITADLRVWLKSNEGFTPSSWTDFSGFNNHYTQTNSSRQPFTATTMYNFNPVVDFGTTGADARFMAVPAGKPYSANGTNSSVFTVNLDRGVGGYADIIGFGATTTTASLINANTPVFTRLGANVVNYPYSDASPALPAVAANKLYLNDVSFTVGTAGIKYAQNGTTGANTQTFAAVYSKHADGSILGSQPEVRNGLIGEVIAYERDLTEAEKQRVRTYTSIKYGITLPHDYIASDGTTILWNRTANTGYNNNIAGLANDEGSKLLQKQSNSINDGQQVLIGTTGLANSNAANAVSLTSGQSLLWGDNGLAKSLGVAHSATIGGNPVNLRFTAVWKAQNTGTVGTVRVAWPSGIVNLHLIQSPDDIINTSDTHTPMTGTITVNGKVYNYADVTLADGSYFTFGGYVAGPGGVSQDLSLWYRADNGVETDGDKKVTAWNNSTANDVKLTMSSAAGYIPYNDQTTYTKTWNFNPTLSFDGTNNYLRNNTTAYLNTAGSVHYIAVARLNGTASGYNSLFAISGNDDGFFLFPQSGLVYPMPAIGNGFGATAAGPGSANRFGIYSAILPKTGTPANQRGFYNGLEKIYTSPYPRTGGTYVLPTTGAYIGADGTTGDNPNGDIAEVILYHEPAGGDMSNTNLARVHSYLAIKYGITLDQTTPQNYINSGNAVVWDAATNTGYHHNIAGIGRDDQGGLYQRQSWSVNPGRQVLISTTGLSNTNVTNTGTLTNGQFLIWGDNNLAKAPSIGFGTIGGLPYQRFAAIWRAANVNTVGTVRVAWPQGLANLKLVQSTDNTFDLSDVITEMSGTQEINGVMYAYADVTISDGQYFTFAAYVQAPGGVTTNISHWYRADKLAESAGEGTDVISWTDFTSGVVSAEINGAPLPKFKAGDATYFNFNPGLNFTAIQQMLGNITERTLTATDFNIFTMTRQGMGGTRYFNIGMNNTTFGGGNWDQPGLYANGDIGYRNNAGGGLVITNPGNINFATGNPSIMYHNFSNTSMNKGLNGAATGTSSSYSARGLTDGGHIFGSNGGVNPPGGDDWGFTGDIGELVIYGNGTITAAERNKVESYLAVKYGITLHNSNNYTTSRNAVIWDATANAAYYNNVAGIGNDFISALHQKQSRSQHTNTNGQVIIALGEIAATNIANENALADEQFLLWGDNGNTQAMTNTAGTYTAFTYAGSPSNGRRMNRIWKVQNTNNVSNQLMIRFPQASVGTTTFAANDACAGYVIVFADDAGFTTNVSVKPLTLNGTDYEVSHVFANGASYFTFGKAMPVNNGEVFLPGNVETTDVYNDGCSVGEWAYYRQTGDLSKKLLGTSGYTNSELDNFDVIITPEGTSYNDGVRNTTLMPRISTVIDNNGTALSSGKVRVYYNLDELGGTIVPGAITSGWFYYNGEADEAIIDIYSDGVFTAGKARSLVVAQSGIEDGVHYVEFHNVTAMGSFLYVSSTVNMATILPVTLLYFTAENQAGKALLSWATVTEQNNKGFEIEHSVDGINWRSIDFVSSKAVNGNSSVRLNYDYTHTTVAKGKNFYRLKQTDLDGRYVYSAISTVNFDHAGRLQVYPNPVTSTLLVKGLSGKASVRVLNLNGQVVKVVQTNAGTVVTIDVSQLPVGMYLVETEDGAGNKETYKIVKQ